MASDKKSGSDWEEAEKLGPYQLHEPIPDSASAQGELFRATNPVSGATALVLKLVPNEEASPLRDWQVRLTSSSDHNCLSMEIDSSSRCFSNEKQSAEELVCTFEDVRDGVGQMDQHLSGPREPGPQQYTVHWARIGVAAVVACALVLVCFQWSRPPPVYEPVVQTGAVVAPPVPTEAVLPPTGSMIFESLDGGTVTLARPFPREPYKDQKRPPCKPRIEVEIKGACWVPHKLEAPCPDELYEYKGECFTASMLPPTPPRSLGH